MSRKIIGNAKKKKIVTEKKKKILKKITHRPLHSRLRGVDAAAQGTSDALQDAGRAPELDRGGDVGDREGDDKDKQRETHDGLRFLFFEKKI